VLQVKTTSELLKKKKKEKVLQEGFLYNLYTIGFNFASGFCEKMFYAVSGHSP